MTIMKAVIQSVILEYRRNSYDEHRFFKTITSFLWVWKHFSSIDWIIYVPHIFCFGLTRFFILIKTNRPNGNRASATSTFTYEMLV